MGASPPHTERSALGGPDAGGNTSRGQGGAPHEETTPHYAVQMACCNARGGLKAWDWHAAVESVQGLHLRVVMLHDTGVRTTREQDQVLKAAKSAFLGVGLQVELHWGPKARTTGHMLTLAIGHMVKAAVRTLDLFDRLYKMGVIDKGDEADVESAGIQALRITLPGGRGFVIMHVYGVPNDGTDGTKEKAEKLMTLVNTGINGWAAHAQEVMIAGDLNWLPSADDKLTVVSRPHDSDSEDQEGERVVWAKKGFTGDWHGANGVARSLYRNTLLQHLKRPHPGGGKVHTGQSRTDLGAAHSHRDRGRGLARRVHL